MERIADESVQTTVAASGLFQEPARNDATAGRRFPALRTASLPHLLAAFSPLVLDMPRSLVADLLPTGGTSTSALRYPGNTSEIVRLESWFRRTTRASHADRSTQFSIHTHDLFAVSLSSGG